MLVKRKRPKTTFTAADAGTRSRSGPKIVSRPSRLVDITQYFTAYVLLAGTLVGHDTLGGGNDSYTETVEHLRHLLGACIAAQAGTAHTLKALDGIGLGLGIVLEGYLNGSVPLLVFPELVRKDITLVVQNFGDLLLNF